MTEEQAAGTDDIITEEQAAGTDDIIAEEQAAGTDDIITEEQAAGTDDIITREQAAVTDDISSEEQAAGTDDIIAEEQAAVTDDISSEEQAAVTDDIITGELRHIRSQAAEKLSSNKRLNVLRSQLWQKNILSDEEFVLLGATWDEEGPLGMSKKLIDLMLEKKEQHHMFLQELLAHDPAVHALIVEILHSQEEQAAGTDDIIREEQEAGIDDISAEEQAAGTDDISREEQAAGTDDISAEEQVAGTDDISAEEQAAGTDDISAEEQVAGTDDISAEEQAAGTDDISAEEQAAGTDDISAEEPASGTDDISREEQAAGTDDISAEEQAAGTDDISAEEQAAGTDDISAEEQAAGTDDISAEEQVAGTDDISAEEQAAGTDDISAEEQAAGIDDISTEEQAAGTDDISAEEWASGTDDISTEEQTAGTDDINTDEQAAGTDDIITEEQAAGTDDITNISVDQIHLSLLYVRSQAAEKLSNNNRLGDLRSQLWQKNILSNDEFMLLGTTCDREGPLGMSKKLIDLMLEKKDQHHKFLQGIQVIDQEVYDIIRENVDILQKIPDHIRTTYRARNCHLVKVLPGEKLQLDLHRAEYVMPLVITAERLERQERQGHWLPQSEVKHKYKQVEHENIEEIVEIMFMGSESVALCLGIAGVGKTICTKQIITGWVDVKERLQRYNIVIAIPVREVNVNGSIIDMIVGEESSLGLVTNNMKESFHYCLTEEVFASKILILVDGIDECDITAGTELYQFITGQKYPLVKKLITARPEASLLPELKCFYPDYNVTIHGTSREGVYKYLREVMTDDHTKPSHADVDSLISKCQQEMVEFDLLLIPLYLTLIGFVFNSHSAQYCTFTNFTIPTTTTRLFSSFLNILIRIWMKKIGRKTEAETIRYDINPIGPESNVSKDIKRILIFAFGKISYDLIQQQKYTMSQVDLDQYVIDIEDIKQSGMFCVSQEQGQMLCFFRHKTLQEYMAALYISHVQLTEHTFSADIDSVIQCQEVKTLVEVFPKLSIVLQFLFGLGPELCCKIIQKLSGHICVVSKNYGIDLDYEASLLSEVEDAALSKAFIELVANTKTRVAKSYDIPKNEPSVYNLCLEFSPQQRSSVLKNWYNLYVYQKGQESFISDGSMDEKMISHPAPTDVLCINLFSHLLSMFLTKYQFNHIQSLSLKLSVMEDIGLIQRIFPKLQIINILSLFPIDIEEGIKNMQIFSISEIQNSGATALVSSGSTNSNLHSIFINGSGNELHVSLVENLTQHASLKSLTLSELREIPALWDVASRGLISWENLSVLEISLFYPQQVKEFLEFLQNYAPKLTALTIGRIKIDNSLIPTFSALIQQALCIPPFSQLTTLRLFHLLSSKAVLPLCEIHPPGLQTLGVGWEEMSEVPGNFMDTLCKQCPQVKHLHVGYWEGGKSDALPVCRELISHRASHHVGSQLQVGAYNYDELKYESGNILFPVSLDNTNDEPSAKRKKTM